MRAELRASQAGAHQLGAAAQTVFEIDLEYCPNCGGGELKIIAAILEAPVIERIEAPPVAGSFVCNIGDMLDRMTGGLYRSTPHRVRLNTSGCDRLSFPLFFDPSLDAQIAPIRSAAIDDHATRWDRASAHAFHGTYGDYLLGKIGKVFPDLTQAVL